MRMELTHFAFAGALALCALPAAADEIWDTTFGRMHWETNLGDAAILLAPATPFFNPMWFYVERLALDEMGGRGVYRGHWFIDNAGRCDRTMVNPVTGYTTNFFGQLEISFHNPQPPSGFRILMVDCAVGHRVGEAVPYEGG